MELREDSSMELREYSSRFESLPAITSRNMSSSSSVFFSANQSPFFSPRSPSCQSVESKRSDTQHCSSIQLNTDPDPPANIRLKIPACASSDFPKVDLDRPSSSTGFPNNFLPGYRVHDNACYSGQKEKLRKHWKGRGISHTLITNLLTANRLRSCDVFIGLHGRKPSLLRFANWLRSELEIQGISCFISDRARGKNSRKHGIVDKAMDASSFGVVIITRKSLRNPYTIEELRFFSNKKILVPIFFDLSQGDCLVRDIVERRGEIWEKHGGELWVSYGGLEKEWREAVGGLSRVDEWKLEAQDGNWRDCILRTVTLLAMKMGRRSVVDRLTKWREKADREEFPFPRNENFIGRKKELSELEFILFGDISGDLEKDYFELKAKPRGHRSLTMEIPRGRRRKGKEPVIWKESEKEIEMQSTELPERKHEAKPISIGRYSRRKRSTKIVYGKGIACVSGDSGIGKTELLLEFAYRYHQRYKMVLWIGGESRYIRQNYLNLSSFLEVDVGFQNCSEKSRIKSFEEQEHAAISRVRKELMRNIPFLIVIDNLESEKDWWDHELVMDLLPRFGAETHILISTSLPRVMNLEPLKLSYLSGVEAMYLMQGGDNSKDYSISEIDSLRALEEKVGRLTLGLAIIGAILSELPITPSRLLDTVNRMPARNFSWNGREAKNSILLQLFEVCFSIFDHADGPRSLATRMVMASAWFGPTAIPISLLALAAHKVPEKHDGTRLWDKLLNCLHCGFSWSYAKRSELEAVSMLLRFNIARLSAKEGHVDFNKLVKLYASKRSVTGVAQAVARAVISRGSLSVTHHLEHSWAACFLLFGFGSDSVSVELKVSELLHCVKELVLPLAVKTFIKFSRCSAALELLRLCTNALEAAEQAFVAPVEKWLDKSLCWRPIRTNAELDPCLWEELVLLRATVLETRAKLMMRGGQFDNGDDLIRKAIFIRRSVCGEDHPDTKSARETLSKLTRLHEHVHIRTSP